MKNKICNFVIIILSLFVWIPFIMILSSTLMPVDEIKQNFGAVLLNDDGYASWNLIPKYISLKPLIELLLDSPEFFVMFWNSVKLVLPILLGQVVISVPMAWGLVNFNKCKLRKIIFGIYMVLMVMPFQVSMVSNYLVLDKLHILNTRFSIILPAIFSTFPVFILYQFFKGIPKEIIEAGEIDGANNFQIFISIAIPMGRSGIISILILGFLEYWNLIEQPLAFLKDSDLFPLSLYISKISYENIGIATVSAFIMLLPSLLVFLYGQTYLEDGIKASGMKE
ncbi:MAG: carbohydrate ABC transporter permease [Clostridiales bacterium]|nr:carbohydrate ABC transporter permease [Clostridiales bacterium]